jgi:hypothetical protein
VDGVFAVVWNRTDAFGLRGQPTPFAAFEALTATSCLSDLQFRTGGGHTVQARCPHGADGPYYQGVYDKQGFDALLCDEQPRQAFTRWWQWNKQYQLDITLAFEASPVTATGDEATFTATMTLRNAEHLGGDGPYLMRVDKSTGSGPSRPAPPPSAGGRSAGSTSPTRSPRRFRRPADGAHRRGSVRGVAGRAHTGEPVALLPASKR